MKKLIFIIISCFFISCSNNDVIENAVVIQQKSFDEIVKDNLIFKLKKFNRHWNSYNKKIAKEVLIAGENEFNTDHKLVLSIISHESNFKIIERKRNKNKTTDFGLSQQNSCEINKRYKRAEEILKRRKLKYSKSKYDVAKNIMACYIYLNDIKNVYSDFEQIVTAYNIGIRGVMLENKKEVGKRYYIAILKQYMEFLN